MHRRIHARLAAILILLTLATAPAFATYRLVHIAGAEESGFAGDGGPAIRALLNHPAALAVAPDGSLYIADTANHRVRRISPDGVITTVAGNGLAGPSGDGGPAVLARLNSPQDVAVDHLGTLYIVDGMPPRVRRVDAPTGRIDTLLGPDLGRFALANDAQGDVFIAVSRFIAGISTQPYLLSLPREDPLSIVPIQFSGDGGNSASVVAYGLAAKAPQRVLLAFDDASVGTAYGVGWANGPVLLDYCVEEYALLRPADIGISPSGRAYFNGGSFYSAPSSYVLRLQGRRFESIGGGGTDAVVDGADAAAAALHPGALAVASDDLIYVVHDASRIFALRREPERPGTVVGNILGIGGLHTSSSQPRTVSIFLRGDNGTARYARPNDRGHFRFRDLPPGNYRVKAAFDEEGLSCDATNCGWSGAPGDCPRFLNDPMVTVSAEHPRQRVHLQLLISFPCI